MRALFLTYFTVTAAVLSMLDALVTASSCSAGQYVSGSTAATGGKRVTCSITIDNSMGPTIFNGQTLSVSGNKDWWPAVKTFSFNAVPGATLIIQGFDWEAGNSGHCNTAGLGFFCSSTDPWWNGFTSVTRSRILAQGGTWAGPAPYGGPWSGAPGWRAAQRPCTTSSGFYLSGAVGNYKIWAPAGERYARFTIVDGSNGGAATITCSKCPAGQFQNVAGAATSCKPCGTGHYQNSEGQPSCIACLAGQKQAATGQSSCIPCDAGRSQSSRGSTSCAACAKGQYQANTGQSSCAACAKGRFASSTQSTTCQDCGAGYFQDTTSSSSCKPCALGRSSSSSRSHSCGDCAAGQYQDVNAATSCILCSAGMHNSGTKQTLCFPCAVGKFQTAKGASSCSGTCSCGYYCPAGSTHGTREVCGEGRYCPAGTTSRNSIGANQGTPVGANPERFCGAQACPSGSACANGEAEPNLVWSAPAVCRANSAGAPYVASVDEGVTNTPFGAAFAVSLHHSLDASKHTVAYSVTRWPAAAPAGCGPSRGKTGVSPKPSGSWLALDVSARKLVTTSAVDAESCSFSYAAQVSATLTRKSDSVALGALTCAVNIIIGDINERPSILTGSLATRSVSEADFPGASIGTKLQAFDPEVAAGTQQLTWTIVKCEPYSFSRTAGAGAWQPDMVAASGKNCHIKISACDGQLGIASSLLNYETFTKYRLVVQVTDDGSPAYDSAQSAAARTVVVTVTPTNDAPSIDARQNFYIRENVPSGTYVNLKTETGTSCHNTDANRGCEMVASDVDSDSTGFLFVQSSSEDTFAVTRSATRHASGKDKYGDDAFNIFTTIQFVSTRMTLNFESPKKMFDLSVYAQDGKGARSPNDCAVTIYVIDGNDKPYLKLPETCGGAQCVHVDENNNEGSESDRFVPLLAYVKDEDEKDEWKCCHAANPFHISPAPTNGCTIWNGLDGMFAATANGFRAIAGALNFEASASCDLIVKVTDKGGFSTEQLVRVMIDNINDPPYSVGLVGGGSCAVEENTPADQQLVAAACQLEAADEDDTLFTFTLLSPPGTTGGEQGPNFIAQTTGATTPAKWASLDYFRLESNGKFAVETVPDFEVAHSVIFAVIAHDKDGRRSASTPIQISILDVNERPTIDAAMSPERMPPSDRSGNGDNMLCQASFTTREYRKDTDGVIAGQTIVPLFDGGNILKPQLDFSASDPDVSATDALWRTITYNLTANYYDSDAFKIDSTSGAIQPKRGQIDAVDFESLIGRIGLADGIMRINVVATDGGGQATDCDIIVNVLDVNEAPFISHLYVGGENGNGTQIDPVELGESTTSPFVMDSSNVIVGQPIGIPLPAADPDVAASDKAYCREAALDGLDDDREVFGITTSCQIFVKQRTFGTEGGAGYVNLESGTSTSYYTLLVEAYDQGDAGGQNVLTSEKRMYHIHGTTGLAAPVFNIGNLTFKSSENFRGIVPGQASDTSKDFSYWNVVGAPTKLFVACTDDNVYQRGTTISPGLILANDVNPRCDTFIDASSCNGKPTDFPLSKCEYDGNAKLCLTRQQSLRYQMVPSSNTPDLLRVDGDSGLLSFDTFAPAPDYEALLVPNPALQCDLGPPVRSGNGSASNPFRWIGRFPNGVKGVCRMFDETETRETGKKQRLGFLDAAAMCARSGSRLPKLAELQSAAAMASAPTASGDAGAGANGEPAASEEGGRQGTGTYPLRPMNILDLWNWETATPLAGSAAAQGSSSCRRGIVDARKDEVKCADGTTTSPCPCPITTGIENAENVWTYDGRQARLTSGNTPSSANVWGNPSDPSTVTAFTGTFSLQDALPVLCFVGEEYVNHKWLGNENTPASYRQKVSLPVRGYAAFVRCMDTGDFTVSESRYEYLPQSQKDDRYVFVEIENQPEDPYFRDPAQNARFESTDENLHVGSVAFNIAGFDQDPGEASQLTFALIAVDPPVLSFELGELSQVYPFETSRSAPLIIKSRLDFEVQPVHTMNVSITDPSGGRAVQAIIINVLDENEAPELRNPDNPSEVSLAGGTYKKFFLNESAPAYVEVGELVAWDPDLNNVLLFTVVGPDNVGDVFDVRRTDRTSPGAGATGSMTVAVLELRNAAAIDYETKQLFTLNLAVTDGTLKDTAIVEVEILNVNDVTIEDVAVISSGAKTLQAKGGETVNITGSNFGVKYISDAALMPHLHITYGRLDKARDTWFIATGCSVQDAGVQNTVIVCTSAVGYGTGHTWRVEVRNNQTGILEGFAQSSVTTGYATPSISKIVLEDGGGAATALDTRGGTRLALDGTNFGPLGLELEGFYASDPGRGWYCAMNCSVTVADTTATCTTAPGIGAQMMWKFEKIDHDWRGIPLVSAEATTAYAVPSISDVANCENCTREGPGRVEFSTHGGEDVFITGNYFGPVPDSSDTCAPADSGAILVSYYNALGYSYEQRLRCEVVSAHTIIKCKTLPGVSNNYVWTVRVAGQQSAPSVTNTFYTPPIISALRGPGAYNADTKGGQKFYLEGDFFGPQVSCAGTGGVHPADHGCIDSVRFVTTDIGPSVVKHVFVVLKSEEPAYADGVHVS